MKREPFVPMLPTELNAAIGAFITTWGTASGLLTMLISNLSAGRTLGPKDDMVFAYAHVGMDVRVQIGLIKTMGAARMKPQHEQALRKLCDRLDVSNDRRNKFAHAQWSVDASGSATAQTLKTVGKVKLLFEVFDAETVNAATQDLVEALGDLVVLVQGYGFLADYEISSSL